MNSLEPVVVGVHQSPGRGRPPAPAFILPSARERRRGGAIVSILVHALIILLLLGAFQEREELIKIEQGAGGPGPAGGGGGGHRGTGGTTQEHVAFMQPVPPHPPTPQLIQPPPVVPPPVPVVKPPDPVPVTPLPQIQEQKTEIKVETAAPTVVAEMSSLVNGTGGGSGNDGSRGNGPGSGGGLGSGVGTGRGSAVGPGTGGGLTAEYAPTPISLFIAPMPVPKKFRGVTVTATFDIDSTGRVLFVDFMPKLDKDYDKTLLEVLKNFEFRPGTKADGTPIRMKYQVSYSF